MTLMKTTSAVLIAAMMTACATGGNTTSTNNTNVRTTAIGAGTGAALGGLLGAVVSKNGNKNEGALLGAVLGGILGGAVGDQYGKKVADQLDKLSGTFSGTDSNIVKQDDGSLKINLAGDTSFNSGSATIKETFADTLDQVAKVLIEMPKSRVSVVGHTDSSGNAAANQRLSLARADSVRDFLVTGGVSNSRISTVGRGSTQPLVSEQTDADRAKNRRVEIFIYPETK